MPITATVGRREYQSTDRYHAEEVMFSSGRYDAGDFEVEMNGWPCTGERHHNCHELFIRKSAGRTITVIVEADHGGYAANHGLRFGSTGQIVYADGVPEVIA